MKWEETIKRAPFPCLCLRQRLSSWTCMAGMQSKHNSAVKLTMLGNACLSFLQFSINVCSCNLLWQQFFYGPAARCAHLSHSILAENKRAITCTENACIGGRAFRRVFHFSNVRVAQAPRVPQRPRFSKIEASKTCTTRNRGAVNKKRTGGGASRDSSTRSKYEFSAREEARNPQSNFSPGKTTPHSDVVESWAEEHRRRQGEKKKSTHFGSGRNHTTNSDTCWAFFFLSPWSSLSRIYSV